MPDARIRSMATSARWRDRWAAVLLGASLVAAAATFTISRPSAEEAQMIPGPALDEPTGDASSEVAVLAGGCFWGVQGVFQHVEGVVSAVSGYAGGEKRTAQYEICLLYTSPSPRDS